MRRDPRARLFDVLDAAAAIKEFTQDLDLEAYESDRQVRSAVMYQLMVIGEALNLLAREDPALAERIPQVPDAVGMRNVLIHGYEIVDHEVVWATIHQDVPAVVAAILAALPDDSAAEPPLAEA